MPELVTWRGHVDLVYIIASIWYPHHNKHCATLSLTSQPFIPSPIPQIIAGAHLLTFATLDTWRLHWPLRRKRVQTLHDSTNSCFAQNPFITHILFCVETLSWIMIILDDQSIVIVLHWIFSFCLRRKCHPWLPRKSSPGPSEEEQKYKWIISAFQLEMEVAIDTADTSLQHFRQTFVRYTRKSNMLKD